MEYVTDEMLKRDMARALNEPAVPQELVERTVDRVNAITFGRAAEKKLSALPESAPAALKTGLAAKAVTGKLVTNRRPPAGVTAAQMTAQLEVNEKFRALTSGSPSKLVHDIRSGELIRKMAAPEVGKQTFAASAPDTQPDLSAPDTLSI